MRPTFPEAFELFYAVFEGSVDDVTKRLAEGDNPNAISVSGTTPIFYAVRYSKDLKKADALFEAGAVINVWDYYGKHPLHWSWRTSEDVLCIRWLLDHNVDPNVAVQPARESSYEPLGTTALHLLVQSEKTLPCIELIISRGANVNTRMQDGSTPLHIAARQSKLNKKLIRALIDAGADVNLMTANGRTPLHEIASSPGKNAKAITRLLISRGASVNIRDASGLLPIDMLNESPLENSLRTILLNHQEGT
jgi:ankyrin repeat protein